MVVPMKFDQQSSNKIWLASEAEAILNIWKNQKASGWQIIINETTESVIQKTRTLARKSPNAEDLIV
jgi:dsDNA-binding SOS-regulon protein